MSRLTNPQRAAIYRSWKDGATKTQLAEQYGVTVAAVVQLIKKLEKAENQVCGEPERKPGVINEEFEQAVDQMVAEREAADAEPAKLPAAVRRAVIEHIQTLKDQIEQREERIAELRIEQEEFRRDIDTLIAWEEAQA